LDVYPLESMLFRFVFNPIAAIAMMITNLLASETIAQTLSEDEICTKPSLTLTIVCVASSALLQLHAR